MLLTVFNLKLKALLNDILINGIFGKVDAHIYVIEWQKRGLPHAHILICLAQENKIKTVEQVNNLVSAEIPDPKKFKAAYLWWEGFFFHYVFLSHL